MHRYIDVPKTGAYTFAAPEHLYCPTTDAGFDLRLFVGGHEWDANASTQGEDTWSVALEKGLQKFEVSIVDYRWEAFRNEIWMTWQKEQLGEGIPVLEMAGPGMERKPIPGQLLMRKSMPEAAVDMSR